MSENNSMILFHPDNNPATMHAIRLNYNHLKYQRTQIYGNLMYAGVSNKDVKRSNYKQLLKLK